MYAPSGGCTGDEAARPAWSRRQREAHRASPDPPGRPEEAGRL